LCHGEGGYHRGNDERSFSTSLVSPARSSRSFDEGAGWACLRWIRAAEELVDERLPGVAVLLRPALEGRLSQRLTALERACLAVVAQGQLRRVLVDRVPVVRLEGVVGPASHHGVARGVRTEARRPAP